MQRFCDSRGVNLQQSFFYADGDEDAALMRMVGHPRPVNPRAGLAALAASNDWPVLRMSPPGNRPDNRRGADALAHLPALGEEAVLHVETQWSEATGMRLYGFLGRDERRAFVVLQSMQGGGPKAALGVLDILSPAELAQAAAGDHGGSAHADVGVLGGDDHVAAAEQCGVSGEASARGDAYQRNGAGQASEQIKRHRVETRHHGGVGIAGPSPATLGEQHHRQPLALGQLEEPVLFPVVLVALRAGEHRVVVRHHHHACPLRPNPVDADRCDAADQAVRRGVGDQVVLAAASTLGGNHQRAVLDERPVVDEVLDLEVAIVVFQRGPSVGRELFAETA